MILNVRKLPVTVQAMEYNGTPESNREIIDWTRSSTTPAHMGDMEGDHQTLYITTLEGEHRVTVGDFVMCGVNGEYYPCKPDIFHKTYVVANSLKAEIIKDIDMVVSKIVATLERTRQHSLAITKLEEANHWLKDIE